MRLPLCLLLVALLAAPAPAAAPPDTLAAAVEAAKAGRFAGFSPYERDIAFPWHADWAAFAKRLGPPLTPKPALIDGNIARWLVPCLLPDGRAGAFFPFDATGRLAGLPDFTATLEPGFAVSREAWEQAATVNDLPELAELLPIKLTYSAGIPVDPARIPGVFMVAGLPGRLPAKSQEERFEWLKRGGWKGAKGDLLKAHLGRRTGTSKCLCYAASTVADYWTATLGHPLPGYTNFISGVKEYGTNPRHLEALYETYRKRFPRRFWHAPGGKDRVTGEPIPWSIKAYVETIFNARDIQVTDPINPKVAWSLGREGFHMDLTPMRIFKGPTPGKGRRIKEALRRYGPLLAQHTMRVTDSIPNPFIGVHAVVLVGHFAKDGDDWFIYQESFGPYGENYLEDSVGGPRYRAMPARLFYQAWGFPHTLRADLRPAPGGVIVLPKSHENRPIAVDAVEAVAGSRTVAARRNADGAWFVPTEGLPNPVLIEVRRAHFCPLRLSVAASGDRLLVKPLDTVREHLAGFEPLDSVFAHGDRGEE